MPAGTRGDRQRAADPGERRCRTTGASREEIFGPVLCALPWTGEAEAIRIANASHYGLAAYVWTHDIGKGLRTAHQIEAGWAQVNQRLGQFPGQS